MRRYTVRMLEFEPPSEGRLEETKRIARVLRIVQLIGAHPRAWSRGRLAREFELSERTIDKDLELIRNGLRYDLRHTREGYYFESGPFLKPIDLTVPEALALALAAQQARDTGAVDAAVIGGVLARLERALPGGIVPYIRRAGVATPAPFGPVRERGATLATLERAIAEGRMVAMEYATASRGGAVTRRTIAPYHLYPYKQSWNAIARDSLRGKVIEFKIDRIVSCELTETRYTIPEEFDPIAYLGPAWGVLRGESGPPEDVELCFSARAGRWVCDDRWHPSQTTETAPNGDLIMRFHCGVTNELVRWVLSFGADVYVELPDHLRKSVVEEAKKVVGEERGAPPIASGGTEE